MGMRPKPWDEYVESLSYLPPELLAGRLVGRAIKYGMLQKGMECETCKVPRLRKKVGKKLQAHHDDYLYPLNVRWLCQSCHFRWHVLHGPGKNRSDGGTRKTSVSLWNFPYEGLGIS